MLLLNPYKNAFFHAIRNGDENTVIESLARPGFDADGRNIIGANGLHCAARYNQSAVMPHLVQACTAIDGIDQLNNTPLMVAAAYQREEAVDTLLELGAAPDARPAFTATALMIAADKGNVPIMKKLLNSGADVHAISGRFEGRRNSLNYAIEAQQYDAAACLIEAGAKPWFINRHQIAAARDDVRELLVNARDAFTEKDHAIMAPQMHADDVYNNQGTIIDIQTWKQTRQNKPQGPRFGK